MKGKFHKKEKVILVFDEKDRRDFLTGFRKRKNERRKIAQEENKKKEEDKRKQLREEKREALRHHIQEYEDQLLANKTEIDENLSKQPDRITHDFGQHTVTVSTITDEDMGKDFLTCAYSTQNQSRTTDNRITTDTHKQTARGKSLRQKQFRKRAQKRKIQAASDKKSVKQKLKHKGGKKKIN